MRRKYTLSIVAVFLLFMCSPAFGGVIVKVKGSRAKVKSESSEFKKGDSVLILDEFEDEAGTGRVYKIRRKSAYIRILDGRAARGYQVKHKDEDSSDNDSEDSSERSRKSAVKGHLGFSFIDPIDSTPLVFAADYEFSKDLLGGFLKNWRLQAGFLYWSSGFSFFNYSTLEISGGLETKIMQFGKVHLNGGLRFGYARTTVSTSGFFGAGEVSDGGLLLSPQINAMYPINNALAVGGELRVPFYMVDAYDFFDVFYVLGSFKYSF